MRIPETVRALIAAGPQAHLTTLNPERRVHLDGHENVKDAPPLLEENIVAINVELTERDLADLDAVMPLRPAYEISRGDDAGS